MKTVPIGEAYFNIWLNQLKKNMLKCVFKIPIYLYNVFFKKHSLCFWSADAFQMLGYGNMFMFKGNLLN